MHRSLNWLKIMSDSADWRKLGRRLNVGRQYHNKAYFVPLVEIWDFGHKKENMRIC